MRLASATLLFALLGGCSDRPAWAGGRVVRERRPANAAPQNLADLERRLLVLHNRARAEVGAPPLAWDARLASEAAAYASQIAKKGRLAHSPQTTRAGQGENL